MNTMLEIYLSIKIYFTATNMNIITSSHPDKPSSTSQEHITRELEYFQGNVEKLCRHFTKQPSSSNYHKATFLDVIGPKGLQIYDNHV